MNGGLLQTMPAPESHPVPLAPPPRRLIAEEPPAAPYPAMPLAQLAGAIPTGGSGPPAAREAGKSAEQRRRESDERTISHKVRGFWTLLFTCSVVSAVP